MMNCSRIPRDALRSVKLAMNLDIWLGVEMWDLLKKTDIEQAKQKLELRRAETLRRHAEESQISAADQVKLETLYHLIDTFSQKYLKFETLSMESIPAPVSLKNINHQNSPEVRHHNHPTQSRTNFARTTFDTFARAVSRA